MEPKEIQALILVLVPMVIGMAKWLFAGYASKYPTAALALKRMTPGLVVLLSMASQALAQHVATQAAPPSLALALGSMGLRELTDQVRKAAGDLGAGAPA